MRQNLGSKASDFFEFYINPNRKHSPSKSWEQERCIINLYLLWIKSRMQIVCDRFDILWCLRRFVLQLNKHGPSVKILSFWIGSWLFRFRYILMSVSKFNPYDPRVCLSFFKLLSHLLSCLQLVEVLITHWTCYFSIDDALDTLEAHFMLARSGLGCWYHH